MSVKDRTLKDRLEGLKTRLYGRRTKKAIKKNRGNSNNILIIKFDGLGDFILFLDAAKELRNFFKDKNITLACQELVVPIAKESGYFDNIVTFSHEAFLGHNLKKTYGFIRKKQYDLLLHPNQPRSLDAEKLAYLVNAKLKIASVGECGALPEKVKKQCDKTYDSMIDQGIYNMSIIQSAEFLRGIGDKQYKAHLPKIETIPPSHIYLPQDFFIIFLGGSVYNKLWPAERYYQIAKYLQERTGWDCVLCGIEKDLWQESAFAGTSQLKYYSLLGKTNINELIDVISKSKLVIGNDTSAIHIANAVGVQSICVKGLFSGNKFYPYKIEDPFEDFLQPIYVSTDMECFGCTMKGRNYECINDDYYAEVKVPCIVNVTVDMVKDKVDEVLKSYLLM